jgi:hypothetical protein
MFDLLDLNVGFWTGILVLIGAVVVVWGLLYASALSGMLAWIGIVAVAVIIIWVVGARLKRFAVMGGRRRRRGNR